MSPLSSCLALTVGNLSFNRFSFDSDLRDLPLIINISIKFDLCEFSDPLNLCRFRLWRYSKPSKAVCIAHWYLRSVQNITGPILTKIGSKEVTTYRQEHHQRHYNGKVYKCSYC